MKIGNSEAKTLQPSLKLFLKYRIAHSRRCRCFNETKKTTHGSHFRMLLNHFPSEASAEGPFPGMGKYIEN